MISLIDTHCHLDLPEFDADRPAVIARAAQAHVDAIVLIGFNPTRWMTTASLCATYPMLVRSVGIHPNEAGCWSAEIERRLQQEVSETRPVAIGEIGLDFFRRHADPHVQRAAFEAQVDLACEADLPIIVHQRDAEADVLAVLEAFAPVRGIMHCFSGDREFAERCLALGLHLGVGGVATYPKSGEVRDALAAAPLDRLVVETDAPYLAPQPWRGKRNEPGFICATAETLAAVRGMSMADVAAATSANAVQVFGPTLDAAVRAGREQTTCA